MSIEHRINPREDWSSRPATQNQLLTMYRMEAFAKGLKEPEEQDSEAKLTMLEAHKRINRALKQIETNLQTGGTKTNFIMSSEEWKQIKREVSSGDAFRGGMSKEEWIEFQKEIYEDLERRGII